MNHRCIMLLSFTEKEIVMSVETVAGKFMELCKQGKHFDVMRTM